MLDFAQHADHPWSGVELNARAKFTKAAPTFPDVGITPEVIRRANTQIHIHLMNLPVNSLVLSWL